MSLESKQESYVEYSRKLLLAYKLMKFLVNEVEATPQTTRAEMLTKLEELISKAKVELHKEALLEPLTDPPPDQQESLWPAQAG